jgi:hypothetical protein
MLRAECAFLQVKAIIGVKPLWMYSWHVCQCTAHAWSLEDFEVWSELHAARLAWGVTHLPSAAGHVLSVRWYQGRSGLSTHHTWLVSCNSRVLLRMSNWDVCDDQKLVPRCQCDAANGV